MKTRTKNLGKNWSKASPIPCNGIDVICMYEKPQLEQINRVTRDLRQPAEPSPTHEMQCDKTKFR